MRIVQIIDSLEAGGAERMAINYANALSKRIVFSGLIVTRKEGLLKEQLDQNVSYLFLNKKKVIDIKAVFKLRKYLKTNHIEIIHAHSSSFFTAVLVKIVLPKIKIVWHDHFGISQDLQLRKNFALKWSSALFEGIISVNEALKLWAQEYLNCNNVICLPNFVCELNKNFESVKLKGIVHKRIICVANLRPQKNLDLLIEGASLINKKFSEWTFHLVGKDFNDAYSAGLKTKVQDLNLVDTVYFYDTVKNVNEMLKGCDIAVLTSCSEGLPLAILEYGINGMPVVATKVGDVAKIISSNQLGLLIESNNLEDFVNAVQKLILEEDTRADLSKNLKQFVVENFSEKAILKDYVLWLQSLNLASKCL